MKSGNPMIAIYAWGVAIAVIAAGITAAVVLNRKRKAALKQLADRLGFAFQSDETGIRGNVGSFELFKRRRPRFSEILSGVVDGTDVSVFTFTYTVTSGTSGRRHHHRNRGSSTHLQTVICLRDSRLRLTPFYLQPEGFFDAIAEYLGYSDINFPEHPEFSKKFKLQGVDESAVRALFTPNILNELSTRPAIYVEGAGDTMLFYIINCRLPPDGIEDVMRDCLTLKNNFLGS